MKKIIKILSPIILILSIFSGYIIRVYDAEINDQKVYCTVTINDNFAGDTIVLVLNKEATFLFEEYNEDNFKELGDIVVEEITKETTEIV